MEIGLIITIIIQILLIVYYSIKIKNSTISHFELVLLGITIMGVLINLVRLI